MMHRSLGLGVLAAAAAVVVCDSAFAGLERKAVAGRFTAAAEGGSETGRFLLSWVKARNDVVTDLVEVACKGLDATADGSGNLPVYDLWLTTSDSSSSVDFGDLRLASNGNAGFQLNTRSGSLPEGVSSVADFSGGTIEVRNGDTVVLSATIPTITSPSDSGTGGRGLVRGTTRLAPADGMRGRGFIEAVYRSNGNGTSELLRVDLLNVRRAGAPYAVVAIATDTTETELFSLTPRGRLGFARGVLNTRREDTIPGGGLTTLSAQNVEVRDKDGNVVMTGSFPTISVE